MTDSKPPSRTQGLWSLVGRAVSALRETPLTLVIILLLCVISEVVLMLGDFDILPTARLRTTAYEYGGFWAGLLQGWRPNFAWQPYTMFVTYAFLHGGATHMVVNMISLWSLGRGVCARVGSRGFLLLYAGSVLGGATGFGLLTSQVAPMVGASGGLFGLAGGILAWNYVDRFHTERTLLPILQMVGLLIVLNVVLWWAMDGLLAWETHLGGFCAGWIIALLIDPRGHDFDPQDLER